MTTTKSRAEELADALAERGGLTGIVLTRDVDAAIDELRRLASVDAEREILQRKVSEQALQWLSLDGQANELMAELERLKAECEGLRKDAERYRWLCEFAEWPDDVGAAFDCAAKPVIDSAIDSAMRESGKGGE